jgi:hypothetical protein
LEGGVLMKKAKLLITVYTVGIVSAILLGTMFSAHADKSNSRHNNETAVETSEFKNIEEALYGVNVVIEGTVTKVDQPEKRDSGIVGKASFQYDVTPAEVRVDNVIYGQAPDSTTITYLQHGIESDSNGTVFVHEGDKVVLLLVKTDDGKYWSYNFNDGIWKNVNGKLKSKTDNVILKKLDGENADSFKTLIKEKAALQKKPE